MTATPNPLSHLPRRVARSAATHAAVDRLSRALAGRATRRGALGPLAALVLGLGAGGSFAAAGAAAKGKGRKKKRRKKRNRPCRPDCGNRECGPDGCGGSCAPGCSLTVCLDGQCTLPCVPDCAGKICGDDGCGGECPPGCEPSLSCHPVTQASCMA